MIEKHHSPAAASCHWTVDTGCILSCPLAGIDVVNMNSCDQDERLIQVEQQVPGLFDWVIGRAYAEVTVAAESLNLVGVPLVGHKSDKLLDW